jgi:hypothetical protein
VRLGVQRLPDRLEAAPPPRAAMIVYDTKRAGGYAQHFRLEGSAIFHWRCLPQVHPLQTLTLRPSGDASQTTQERLPKGAPVRVSSQPFLSASLLRTLSDPWGRGRVFCGE